MTELEVLHAMGWATEKDRVRSFLVSALQHITFHPDDPPANVELSLRLAREEIGAVLNKYLERL